MRALLLLPLLLFGARADDDLTTCTGAIAAFITTMGTECEGQCTGADSGDDCTYSASICGTTACATAVDTVITGIDDIVTGFLSCSGSYAGYATYGSYGADYLSIIAFNNLVQCELDISSYYDSSTCLGSYALLQGLQELYCECPEVCEGGTGSCDVDEDSDEYCTGDCEDDCDCDGTT